MKKPRKIESNVTQEELRQAIHRNDDTDEDDPINQANDEKGLGYGRYVLVSFHLDNRINQHTQIKSIFTSSSNAIRRNHEFIRFIRRCSSCTNAASIRNHRCGQGQREREEKEIEKAQA